MLVKGKGTALRDVTNAKYTIQLKSVVIEPGVNPLAMQLSSYFNI